MILVPYSSPLISSKWINEFLGERGMELRCERSVMGVMGRRRENGSDERERMSYSTGWRYVGMWRSDLGLKFGEIP